MRAPKLLATAAVASFYSFSEPIPTKPGALIKSERVAAPSIKGAVYRVLYVSTTVDGKPTPVTGIVIVPNTRAPAAGYPVVSWGHGTNGMADSCAPSIEPDSAVPLVNMLLDQGWEVTASDYQGEGTPRRPPLWPEAGPRAVDLPGQSHAGVVGPSAGDMVHWITDRFAGGANPDRYTPKGLAGIRQTTCA